MKRVLSIVLSAVILLSALCFVSCESEPEVIESINGMTAKQAAEAGLKKLEESDRYRVTIDGEIQLNALVATIPVGIDNFYENTTDGENMHYKFTDEDLLFIDNEQLFSLLKGYDKEVWYVDGTRYSINTAGEKVVDSSGRKPSNVVEKIIDTVSEEELNTAVAYTKDGEAYIELTVMLEEYTKDPITCKLYVDSTGRPSRAELKGTLYGLGLVLTLNFEYENISKLTAPKGFENVDDSGSAENGKAPADNGGKENGKTDGKNESKTDSNKTDKTDNSAENKKNEKK